MRNLEQAVSTVRWAVAILGVGGAFSCLAQGKPAGQGNGGNLTSDGGVQLASADGGLCAATVCDPPECGSGMRAMPLPGECCPTLCEPTDCSTVDCAPI